MSTSKLMSMLFLVVACRADGKGGIEILYYRDPKKIPVSDIKIKDGKAFYPPLWVSDINQASRYIEKRKANLIKEHYQSQGIKVSVLPVAYSTDCKISSADLKDREIQ